MEISSKELREVEFRERLRGYDTTEVDEFLERVAVAVDELHAQLRQMGDRAVAEQAAPPRPPSDDDDTLRRTLILAQRTADMAIREAQEQAEELLENARAEADAALAHAQEAANKLATDAQRELHEETERLTGLRDSLRRDVRTLSDLLETERGRLSEALSSAPRWIDQGMAPSPAMEAARAAPLSHEGVDAGDGIGAQVQADALAAAPAPPADHYADEAPVPVEDADTGGGASGQHDPGEQDESDHATSSGGGAGFGLEQETPMRFTSISGSLQQPEAGRDARDWRLGGHGNDPGWSA
jgi:DivIVA domain-containing protein